MANSTQRIGWIGMGPDGLPDGPSGLLKAGHDVSIWNRTKSKAEPLAKVRRQGGSTSSPILRTATWCFRLSRPAGTSKRSTSATMASPPRAQQRSAESVRRLLDHRAWRNPPTSARSSKDLGSDFLACPVSGNAKVIKAGKLSAVASGPEALFRQVQPLIEVFRAAGRVIRRRGASSHASARSRHNVMLGVVIENLIEIMLGGREGRRAAPCVPRLHEQWRDGLDVHCATNHRRWSISTGPRRFTPELFAQGT